jgi:23S rRNA G2069 N7-methylase RlmK/C1962 C5-methylase RlmI
MLWNRLVKRRRHLSKWARRRGIDAYRLYDRDIPEIPLLIDWYAGAASLSLYKRPYEKDDAEEGAWLSAMKEAASKALEVPEEMIFCRERKRLRGGRAEPARPGGIGNDPPRPGGGAPGLQGMDPPADRGFERIVHEGGLLYKVNLSGRLDTGLFLDRRKLRGRIREQAAGKRVLNLFSYTCSFSICAAAGGAAVVDSVDLSNTYLEWGAENFRLNGIDPRFVREIRGDRKAGPFTLMRADVLLYIEAASRARLSWDMIILDPPVFSNSKKMTGTLDIRRDHRELLRRCMGLLKPGGALYFSAGTRRFRLDPEIPSALRAGREIEIEDLRAFAADEDFPPNRAPFCYRFELGGNT